MKKFLLLSVSILTACALFAGTASAADPADPVTFVDPVAGHDWNGPYAGLHAGWGWGDSDWLFTTGGTTSSTDIDGFVGGGHLGWNWQNGVWVFGVEGDIDFSDINGADPCPNPAFSCQLDVDWLASLRARLGVTSGPLLWFVTGGVAAGEVDPIAVSAISIEDAPSDTHVGYVVGGGVEYWAFMNNNRKISARIEGLYYDLGDETYPLTTPAGALDPANIDVDTFVVRVGVTIHSDRRLKRDITHIATLENGIRLYRFKYLWDDQVHVGVMAQDLLGHEAFRHAVVMTQNGYYAVNYETLGLKMATLEAWRASGLAAVSLQSPGSRVSSLVENTLR